MHNPASSNPNSFRTPDTTNEVTNNDVPGLGESLRRVGFALSATLDLQDLLDMICHETIQLFNVEAALPGWFGTIKSLGLPAMVKDGMNFLDSSIRFQIRICLAPVSSDNENR